MREVSWRALSLPLQIGERAGAKPEQLLVEAGLSTLESLRAQGRLDWGQYVRLLDAVAKVVGDLDQLQAWSAELSTAPESQQAATVGAAFMNPRTFFWAAHKWVARSLFGIMQTEFEVLGPTQVRLTAIIPEPYELSIPLFRVAAGSFGTAPVVAGYQAARVRAVINGRRCDYFIEHEPSRTILTRLRRLQTSLVALPHLFAELREQNDTLSAQIAELDKAGKVAEGASRLRQRFLTAVTHEVRTPLSEVISLARILADGVTPQEVAQVAAQIERSAGGLLARIDDIDLCERGIEGEATLERKPFDWNGAVQGWSEVWTRRAAEKSLQFKLESQLDEGVMGDPGRIQRALDQLVDNAIKFSSKGTVTLRARRSDPGRVEIEVEDQGPGIEVAWKERIFEPFVQREEGLARRYGGVGLGLTVARRLTETMGGSLRVVSTLGQGSTFSMSLPLPTCALPAKEPAPSPAEVQPVIPAPVAAAAVGEPKARRVLVVEDNAVNQKVLCRILTQLGFSTEVVENGLEAVRAFEARQYDAILMDLQMPVMDGFAATLEIRRLESGRHTPIIAVTANNQAEFQGRAQEVGMDAFLAKPVQRAALNDCLGKWILPS